MRCEIFRSKNVGGNEYGFAAERADAGLIEHGIDALGAQGGLFPFGGLDHAAAGDGVGIVDVRDGFVESFAIVYWDVF